MAVARNHWRKLGLHLATCLFGTAFGWAIAIGLGFLLIWMFAVLPGSAAVYAMLVPSGADLPVLLATGWILGVLLSYRLVALMLK